ncbi:MAG: hypothetical protein AAF549_09240 [Pseudomonadota bacterium]
MSDAEAHPYKKAFYLKCDQALVAEFNSIKAALLFDRLEYWFSKVPNQFYKFIEPCDHPLYRSGDSWCEETGFSKKVFRTAFDKIGMRYKSKTEFEAQSDPFQGKLYAYYQDRQTKRTIFVRNNRFVSSFLKSLLQKVKTLFQNPAPVKTPSFKKGSPTADPLGSPHAGAYKDKQNITSSYLDQMKNKKKVENESYLHKEKNRPENIKEQDQQTLDRLGHLLGYHLDMTSTHWASSSMRDRLLRCFNQDFEGKTANFEAYLQRISSSKFLMGEREGVSFKINLGLLLKPCFIDKVKDKQGYDFGTRSERPSLTAQDDLKQETVRLRKEIQALPEDKYFKVLREEVLQEEGVVTYKGFFHKAKMTFLEKKDRILITARSAFERDWIQNTYVPTLEAWTGKSILVRG